MVHTHAETLDVDECRDKTNEKSADQHHLIPGLNQLHVIFGEIQFKEAEKYKMKEIYAR